MYDPSDCDIVGSFRDNSVLSSKLNTALSVRLKQVLQSA